MATILKSHIPELVVPDNGENRRSIYAFWGDLIGWNTWPGTLDGESIYIQPPPGVENPVFAYWLSKRPDVAAGFESRQPRDPNSSGESRRIGYLMIATEITIIVPDIETINRLFADNPSTAEQYPTDDETTDSYNIIDPFHFVVRAIFSPNH